MQRIRTALAEDRLVLYGQPILDLRTGQIAKHELLVRMLGDDGELIAARRLPADRRALRARSARSTAGSSRQAVELAAARPARSRSTSRR